MYIQGTLKETGEKDQGKRGREGAVTSSRRFITVRVDDSDLVKELESHGIQYRGEIENVWYKTILSWLIPMLILFAVWGFIFRRMGSGYNVMSFGRSKAKIYAEDETKVTFDDVAGIDEAKEELKEVVEFLKTPKKFQSLGGKIPKGVLLVGPPGTGKTLLAKAVAGEAKVPFFSLSGSDFVEMFVGVGAARVRDLFGQAQQQAPCIVFIDELDALGKTRGVNPLAGHDEREQTLNQLLVEMDGFDTKNGVIIMAATNRPEILDPALLRPGRFDRQVLVDRPDLKGREEILQVHTRKVKLASSVDLRVLAARTPGFVGSDLANVVNEAALLAARKNKSQVEMEDFEEAIERGMTGLEKKSRVMNEKEKRIVAFHESGHAIVAESVPNADPVHKISIIPRGVAALGYTLQLPTEDRYLMTRSELLDRLAVLLGGRIAEELVFGEISTGAQNDLQRATDIARKMVKDFGMSPKLGLVTFDTERSPYFLPGAFVSGKEYSEVTAKEIDDEVKALIDTTYTRVKEILTQRRDVLEALAQSLLERETIEGDELRRMLRESAAASSDGQPLSSPEQTSVPTVP
ncbi:MAG: ATP-dependent zinc metalloprotease FtsH [Candidatus Tectomicrobia bacterium]|uniref:ATP-dependent zinc metalloprotease FtsH n=1 Tax=Tectimicrobiota bacterium TaxID=2528274 RepID=A0A932CM07_UNCTE|nr:ATP-dependent zinc metalloprotease FtsH [Candidatus Tectomicrobia bacterium]